MLQVGSMSEALKTTFKCWYWFTSGITEHRVPVLKQLLPCSAVKGSTLSHTLWGCSLWGLHGDGILETEIDKWDKRSKYQEIEKLIGLNSECTTCISAENKDQILSRCSAKCLLLQHLLCTSEKNSDGVWTSLSPLVPPYPLTSQI